MFDNKISPASFFFASMIPLTLLELRLWLGFQVIDSTWSVSRRVFCEHMWTSKCTQRLTILWNFILRHAGWSWSPVRYKKKTRNGSCAHLCPIQICFPSFEVKNGHVLTAILKWNPPMLAQQTIRLVPAGCWVPKKKCTVLHQKKCAQNWTN